MGKLKSTAYAVIVILIIIGIVLYLRKAPSVPVPLPSAFVIQLTDPPQVPAGTQALVISYSDLQLHEAAAPNSTGFIDLNQSGSVDLLGLVNFTQTIGVANIKPNMTFNLVRFNITSAKIEIDNSTYNVSVPNNRLTVHISNSNSSAKGVLIDITPSVLEIYAANQTVFVLVPSARAVIIGGKLVNSSSVQIGYKAKKQEQEDLSLESTKPNISIVSASLSFSGNTTTLTAQVKNNGKSTAVLKNLMVFGNMQVTIGNIIKPMDNAPQKPSASFENGNSGAAEGLGMGGFGNFNASDLESAAEAIAQAKYVTSFHFNTNLSNLSVYGIKIGSNGTVELVNTSKLMSALGKVSGGYNSALLNLSSTTGINIANITAIAEHRSEVNSIVNSALAKLEDSASEHLNASEVEDIILNMTARVGNVSSEDTAGIVGVSFYRKYYHRVLNFLIMPNATLSLPFSVAEAEGPNGYNLTPGNTVTLYFKGNISFGGGAVRAANGITRVVTLPLENQSYSIRVIGEDGAFAESNIIAT
ncbi:MAG: hypothetical protein QXK65_02030 [Candidatus Micrarchaeaceae archaeon]